MYLKVLSYDSVVLRTHQKPFQYQSMVGSIPVGTRTIKVYLAANIWNQTDISTPQYCAFDVVQLFIFHNKSIQQ